VWDYISKAGKYISRGIFITVLVMGLMVFVPGFPGKWAVNFWISVDQFGNVLTFGDPDETISSRLGKWMIEEDAGWMRWATGSTICFFLDLIDENHCQESIDPDEGKDAIID
jgi:hypothetical protein